VELIAADKSEDTTAVAAASSNLTTVESLATLLPQPMTAELRTAIEAYGAEFDGVQSALFQPQMSVTDGYHAKPIPIRSSDLFSKNIGSGMRPPTSTSSLTEEQPSSSSDTGSTEESALMVRKAAAIAPMVLSIAQHLPNGAGGSSSGSSQHGLESSIPRTIESLTKSDLLFGSVERLTQGFRRQNLLDKRYARPDFLPIILIPSGPTAAIQLFNVRSFLEEGDYVHPSQIFMSSGPAGDTSREDSKPENVVVSPRAFFSSETLRNSAFSKFRVVDDPRKIENWDHVCACIVTGVDWQLQEWFQPEHPMRHLGRPSVLFDYLRGFLGYFEEDKLPAALAQWNVHPLVLNRKYVKAKAHILQAYTFWEELYRFISTNPRFSRYVASGVDE
jgi:parafibromin